MDTLTFPKQNKGTTPSVTDYLPLFIAPFLFSSVHLRLIGTVALSYEMCQAIVSGRQKRVLSIVFSLCVFHVNFNYVLDSKVQLESVK